MFLSSLVARAATGEDIVIAKAGVPMARLVPMRASTTPRAPGGWQGRVSIADDFDAPLPGDVLDPFSGDVWPDAGGEDPIGESDPRRP